MVNDYEKSIGIWTHEIDEIVHVIKPEEEDNIKFVEIKKKAEKSNDEVFLTKGMGELYYEMVTRSKSFKSEVTSLTPDEKEKKLEGLKIWISRNISKITTDFLIEFKWTTQAKLDKIEESQNRIQEEVQKKKMMMALETSKETS